VTETDAYLWTSSQDWYSSGNNEECTPDRAFASADYVPALLYRVPVDGAAPGLVAARGVPPDQFSLPRRWRPLPRLARPPHRILPR
jgi:hypothetical protein